MARIGPFYPQTQFCGEKSVKNKPKCTLFETFPNIYLVDTRPTDGWGTYRCVYLVGLPLGVGTVCRDMDCRTCRKHENIKVSKWSKMHPFHNVPKHVCSRYKAHGWLGHLYMSIFHRICNWLGYNWPRNEWTNLSKTRKHLSVEMIQNTPLAQRSQTCM